MLPVAITKHFRNPLAARLGFDPFLDLDRLATTFLGERDGAGLRVDIREDNENFYIDAEVPGFARENIDVTCEGGILTIKGERKCEETREGENFHVCERHTGEFTRSFRLPDGIDSEKVDAQLKDGVLMVRIAKAEEVKPRKIEVKAS